MFYDQQTSYKYTTQRTASLSPLCGNLNLNEGYGTRVSIEREDGFTLTRKDCINWYLDQDYHQHNGTEPVKSKFLFTTISNFINIYHVLFKLHEHSYISSLGYRVKH